MTTKRLRSLGRKGAVKKSRNNSGRTVHRAIDVLFNLGEEQLAVGPSEISRKTGIDRATVYRLLQTLSARDLVIGVEGGKYSLGPAVLRLAKLVSGADIQVHAAPIMRQLRDFSRESVVLSMRFSNRRVHIMQEVSPQSVRWQVEIGANGPLYAGSGGKAIFAFLEEDERANALAEPHLPEFAGVAQQAREQAQAEVSLIRNQGYAVAMQEMSKDAVGMAAPIFDGSGKPIAAIAICGPITRLDGVERGKFIEPLLGASAELSRRLGYLRKSSN